MSAPPEATADNRNQFLFAMDFVLRRIYSKEAEKQGITEAAAMIRIKCPKCSNTISLDDKQAGQIGLCSECGAKIRIPAKKAKPPAPAAKSVEKKPAKVSPPRDDDDDQDEQPKGKDDSGDKKCKKRRAASMSDESKGNIATAIAFVPAVILLGLGSIFINRLGIVVAGVSAFLMLTCSLMVARSAMADSTGKFMMVLLVPIYFAFYAISDWKQHRSFFVSYMGFLALLLASLGGIYLHESMKEARRDATRKRIDQSTSVVIVQVFHAV